MSLKDLKDKIALIIPIAFAIVICLYAYGCEPKTKSLLNPANKVSAAELQIELSSLLKMMEVRKNDLDAQTKIRDIILQQSLTVATGTPINPIGIITSVLAVLGITATADDVRLRKQRKKHFTPN